MHREEIPDHRKRQRLVSDLLAAGLGSSGAVSGLQEGAVREAELYDSLALTSRGLDAAHCCMTCVRQPQAYATFAAHVKHTPAPANAWEASREF